MKSELDEYKFFFQTRSSVSTGPTLNTTFTTPSSSPHRATGDGHGPTTPTASYGLADRLALDGEGTGAVDEALAVDPLAVSIFYDAKYERLGAPKHLTATKELTEIVSLLGRNLSTVHHFGGGHSMPLMSSRLFPTFFHSASLSPCLVSWTVQQYQVATPFSREERRRLPVPAHLLCTVATGPSHISSPLA